MRSKGRTSAGEWIDVYRRLKALLKKYEGPFVPKINRDSRYDLWSFKDVLALYRKRGWV